MSNYRFEFDSLLYNYADATQRIECDFIVSATGVTPNTRWINDTIISSQAMPTGVPVRNVHNKIVLDENGGIIVDKYMNTSVDNVFAAGDCCTYAAELYWPSFIRDAGQGTLSSTISSHITEVNDNFFQMKLWTQVGLLYLRAYR